MDKQEIERVQQILFVEMKIGAILYKNSNWLTLSQLKGLLNENRYSDEFFNSTLKNLTSHGIVTAHFAEENTLLYHITDFGKYFFEKLVLENPDIHEYVDNIGGTN